jgi:hypothetical protein
MRTKRSLRNFCRPLRSNEPTRRNAEMKKKSAIANEAATASNVPTASTSTGGRSREARGPPLSIGNVRQAGVDEDHHKNKDNLNVVKVVQSLHFVPSKLENSLVQSFISKSSCTCLIYK